MPQYLGLLMLDYLHGRSIHYASSISIHLTTSAEQNGCSGCFHGPHHLSPSGALIMVDTFLVPVLVDMKYLGLFLDRRRHFDRHFTRLSSWRFMYSYRAIAKLGWNQISFHSQRLYKRVIRSLAFHGAPVWVNFQLIEYLRLCKI